MTREALIAYKAMRERQKQAKYKTEAEAKSLREREVAALEAIAKALRKN